MKKVRTLALGFLSAAIVAGTAMASGPLASPLPHSGDDFTIYKELPEWTVYADQKTESCLIERVDDAGNVMQMGLDKKHKHAYVGIFTLADIDIKNLERVEVVVDGVMFEGRVHRIKSKKLKGDYSGGYIVLKDPRMVTAIAEGEVLVAFPKKRAGVFLVDLTGTKEAIGEARKCNLDLVK